MEGKIRAGREGGVIGVDFADAKNAGGRASVALVFMQARLLLTGEAATPGESFFPKQNRNRIAHPPPRAAGGTLEALQLARHAVPTGSETRR